MQGLDALSPHGARLLLGILVKQVFFTPCYLVPAPHCFTLLDRITCRARGRQAWMWHCSHGRAAAGRDGSAGAWRVRDAVAPCRACCMCARWRSAKPSHPPSSGRQLPTHPRRPWCVPLPLTWLDGAAVG